jgi:hypothetical protein
MPHVQDGLEIVDSRHRSAVDSAISAIFRLILVLFDDGLPSTSKSWRTFSTVGYCVQNHLLGRKKKHTPRMVLFATTKR